VTIEKSVAGYREASAVWRGCGSIWWPVSQWLNQAAQPRLAVIQSEAGGENMAAASKRIWPRLFGYLARAQHVAAAGGGCKAQLAQRRNGGENGVMALKWHHNRLNIEAVISIIW